VKEYGKVIIEWAETYKNNPKAFVNILEASLSGKPPKEKGILGNKSLLLIVKVPKGTKVNGRFLIGAEVSSKLSKWLPYPVRTSNDKVVNIEYDLSR
jgi:hypothetical protein